MTINLRKVIGDGNAQRSGGFTGAIFLTYTLNLTFFEQMIAPVLDQAGCASTLILTDPDGYQGAIEMGIKSITDVGRRYVCAPLHRPGHGVQHVKLLLMAGPKQGRLLIGSGNLTLHGYGRNLELYSQFEYKPDEGSAENRYPFHAIWQLINTLANSQDLPQLAYHQIKALKENAAWLDYPVPEAEDFRVWHNLDRSLWAQLAEWRRDHDLVGSPLSSLRVLSPYFDRETTALHRFVDEYSPAQTHLFLDPALTNLDGKRAESYWGDRETKPSISGIGQGVENRITRHVHAKAIIGQERSGSWCVAGSANMSLPAIFNNWNDGGNLELVTFRWSPDPQAFDYLLSDPSVMVWPLNLTDVEVTEPEPSERAVHVEMPLIICDLRVSGEKLEGRLITSPGSSIMEGSLEFLRLKHKIRIHFQDDLTFECQLPAPLETAEAARLVTESWATPYHWIDQPEVLARHSARTYQLRVRGKLETILGAEQLFQELLNFLWERVEPGSERDDLDPRVSRFQRRSARRNNSGKDGPPPPGPEGFITEEILVHTVQWGVEDHLPYDRSLLSLRDLLAIVLIRLTTATQVISTAENGDTRDEDADEKRQAQQEAQQKVALERLRNFLIGYCKRYGRRLTDPSFIEGLNPQVIFQNHFTLSQVIREFASKANTVFSQTDLHHCFWWIWAPLIWPQIVGFGGQGALFSLGEKHKQEDTLSAWRNSNMPVMAMILLSEVLGRPPSWRTGLWEKARVRAFMVAREWINRMTQSLGIDVFSLQSKPDTSALHIQSFESLTEPSVSVNTDRLEDLDSAFSSIKNYRPPMEEKFSPIIRLRSLELSKAPKEDEEKKLLEQIHEQEIVKEYEEYTHSPAPINPVSDDDPYCPRCGGRLTLIAENSLKYGHLVLCTTSRDVWIYIQPKLPDQIIDDD